jgi:hypothetical protein
MKLLVCCLMLALTALAIQAQNSRSKNLTWGRDVQGLRMAVWKDSGNTRLFAAVRNFSDKKICYCDYVLGEFMTLYARKPQSEWEIIKLKPQEGPVVYIGYLPCSNNKILRPDREMPPYVNWRASRDETARFLKGKNYSFEVDLKQYDFPLSWQGTIEVKLVQTIFNGHCDDAYDGKVESPAISINLPLQ